jgi:hypothetical protein
VFGWNGHRLTYDGTTATSGKFDCYRNGYGTGDTTATIATTATPGQVVSLDIEDGLVSVVDGAQNSLTFTPRFSRTENIPDASTTLYLQVRAVNGTVAPASTTTFTLGYISVDEFESSIVSFGRQPGSANAPAVLVSNVPAVTVNSGTVTTVTTVSTLTGGNAAEDAATTANPLIVGGIVRTAVAPTTLVAGDAARVTMSNGAAAVVSPYSVPDVTLAANLSLTTTTATAIRAAGAASVRNYLGALQVYNSSATAVDVIVLDGATEIWRQTVNATSGREFLFPIPLRGTAATALNINLSAAVTAVRATAQTFQAP